jgi:hypothetical protein
MTKALLKNRQPWKNALIATTGLSLFFFVASQLWVAGYEEWAFALIFLAVWTLIFVSWSNVDFTEDSSLILAEIVDLNFQGMSERIEKLELELAALRSSPAAHHPESGCP